MNINLTLIGQLIAFVAFVAFCMRYVWPPIAGAMAERQSKIADGLAAADRAGHDLEVAKQKAEQQLANAKREAAGIIEAANKRAQAVVEEAKEAASAEAERVKAAAAAEIDKRVHKSSLWHRSVCCSQERRKFLQRSPISTRIYLSR